MREFTFKVKLTDGEYDEMSTYIRSLPVSMLLFGLRFSYKRFMAVSGGYLFPGRKSFVKKETLMVTKSQAKWRLKNWKPMIKLYREKGYSYPTISRIKKQLTKLAGEK
jgi:hypothetical protein